MQNRTMIIGGGSCAREIALDLLKKGIEIVIVSRDEKAGFSLPDGMTDARVEILTQTRLSKCHGFVGNFTVRLDCRGSVIERAVSNIVIAEEDRRKADFGLYGLNPSDRVISLSRMKDLLISREDNDEIKKAGNILFLTGLFKESDPVIARDVMLSSLDLQSRHKKQAYILAGNLKVAGDGLEALYRKTRDAGVVYVKFSNSLPSISQREDGGAGIEFYDEISGKQFKFSPDITVVDEGIIPSEHLPELAGVLNVDMDLAGFLQSDNVRRIPVYTNRKGIMAAGPSRTIQTHFDHDVDAANASLSVYGLLKDSDTVQENRAEIDRGRCVRCLTCYRLCPFAAIRLDAKPVVVPDACEGCGICTAECPKTTISIKGLSVLEISDKITRPATIGSGKTFAPFIAAFCCSRSASMARQSAVDSKLHMPNGLITIDLPCAGGISLDHILLALKKGADGVMILTCHEGNCHSEKGNIHARRRTERALELFDQMGLERERLVIRTIAANMATEFSRLTLEFEKQIIALGVGRKKDDSNDKTG